MYAPDSVEPRTLPNPVAGDVLTGILVGMAGSSSVHSIAVTGGEPLLQGRFLKAWLPAARALGFRIYLETAGTLPDRLAALGRVWDYCSMDIKLPSATGMRSFMEEHRAFLKVCRAMGAPTMAKAVISARTTEEEVAEAAAMIAATMPEATLVLQPMTPIRDGEDAYRGRRGRPSGTAGTPMADGVDAVPPRLVLALQAVAMRYLDHVRVIPQMHRQAGIP